MRRWIPSLARPGPKLTSQGGIRLRKQSLLFLTALALFAVLTGCASANKPETSQLADAADEFADIAGHPMEERILEGHERGFYDIPADGLFRPDDPATVGDFLTALWNLSGSPGKNAVDWAADAGYLSGADLSQPLTRQQAMSLLYALNGAVSGVEAMLTGIYDEGFRDSGEIPPGGKQALYWGFYHVLIREPEPDMIMPSGTVSRGDMADILIRYADRFAGESPEN